MRRWLAVLVVLVLAMLTACSAKGHDIPTDWSLARIDSSQLTIDVSHSLCDRGVGISTVETAASVTITAMELHRTGHICQDMQLIARKVVVLQSPLGQRALVGCIPPGSQVRAHACRTASG